MQERSVHSLRTSIHVGTRHLHAKTFCTLSESDTILYPLRAPIFTVLTKVWPRGHKYFNRDNLSCANLNYANRSRVNLLFPVTSMMHQD